MQLKMVRMLPSQPGIKHILSLEITNSQLTPLGKSRLAWLLEKTHCDYSLQWLAGRNYSKGKPMKLLPIHAAMPDEVYVRLPSICGDDPRLVRKLFRALYGHSKAGQLWNVHFVQFMLWRVFYLLCM